MPNPLALDLFTDAALSRRIAREAVEGVSAKHRADLLEALRTHGPQTADAAGVLVGLGPLQARPRVTELAKAGLIEPTGQRGWSALGNRAAVWRAVA